MLAPYSQSVVHRLSLRLGCALAAAILLATATGCGQSSKAAPAPSPEPAAEPASRAVAVVRPERTTLRRTVRQPGSIQAYERTPIFPRIAGYVKKWHVDIDARVGPDDLLVELDVPDRVQEFQQKEALVKQAQAAYKVAEARVESATAQVVETQAGLQRAAANQKRWQLEYTRISKLTGTVLDTQTKDETWNQLQAASAAVKEVEAKVESSRALLRESEAQRDKAQADIAVAEADQRRTAAFLSFARLTAPYAGVVTTRRNVNTGDYVQPPSGDRGEPLLIVERRDLMRVRVEVPETEAGWVGKGTKARIRVPSLPGPELTGEVARTSYSVDRTTRTLVAEIDLPNPGDRLRPGLYAYGTLTAELPDVLTLPASAVVTQGDVLQGYRSYCFIVEDGKARRTAIELGARGTDRVQVSKKQLRPSKPGEEGSWGDFTGAETIVQSDAASLTDGQPVTVSSAP